VTDAEGVILQANRAIAARLQVGQERLVNQALSDFVVEEERPAFRKLLRQLKEGEGVQGWEVRLRPRRRAAVAAALDVTVARDDRGRQLGTGRPGSG
jgi:PAS domain S-box-containing protein